MKIWANFVDVTGISPVEKSWVYNAPVKVLLHVYKTWPFSS